MFVAAGQNELSRKRQHVANCPDGPGINKATSVSQDAVQMALIDLKWAAFDHSQVWFLSMGPEEGKYGRCQHTEKPVVIFTSIHKLKIGLVHFLNLLYTHWYHSGLLEPVDIHTGLVSWTMTFTCRSFAPRDSLESPAEHLEKTHVIKSLVSPLCGQIMVGREIDLHFEHGLWIYGGSNSLWCYLITL